MRPSLLSNPVHNRTEFTYDGWNNRVKIIERTGQIVTSTKKFLFCGNELKEERTGTDVVTRRYFRHGFVSGSSGTPATTDRFFYARDHLGSVREVVDWTNVTRARFDYDPYERRSANPITTNPVAPDFGYTGHYYYVPSTLHLATYRAYNADLGRWLSTDLIGENGGLNLYGYVFNSPGKVVDPLGLDSMQSWAFPNMGPPAAQFNHVYQQTGNAGAAQQNVNQNARAYYL
jgi:RHS repeat-associated protein